MPTLNETEDASYLLIERRTCRCCGRSIMFEERLEIDSDFEKGLDVCPDCILHFQRKCCLEEE